MSEEKKDLVPIADIFDQKLLAKIKVEKMSPTPRWHFLLKNYVVWLTGGLALVIGAGSVSVLTYLMINNDLGIQEINKNWAEILLLTLPYFWMIFLGLFIFVIYYNLKHTKRGYRYPLWAVLLASVLTSVVLGECLYLLGVGAKIDGVLGRHAPLYEHFINPQLDFWSQPSEGRLVGMPVEFSDDKHFILIDQNLKEWEIIPASSTVGESLENMPMAADSPPLPIRLLGEEASDGVFVVEKIIPLLPGRAFFDRPGHGQRVRVETNTILIVPCLNQGNGNGSQNENVNEKKNNHACVVGSEGPMRSRTPLKN